MDQVQGLLIPDLSGQLISKLREPEGQFCGKNRHMILYLVQ